MKKSRKSQQRNRSYMREPNRDYRTEKYNDKKMEMTEENSP